MKHTDILPPWRVGEFWSSAHPGKKVLMLATGADEIADYGSHKDFIRWITPLEAMERTIQGEPVADTGRPR